MSSKSTELPAETRCNLLPLSVQAEAVSVVDPFYAPGIIEALMSYNPNPSRHRPALR